MTKIVNPSSDSPLPQIIREICDTDDQEKETRVGQAAKVAFDYLEATFDEKNNKLKAITSKGSLLNNMNFRTENFKAKVNSITKRSLNKHINLFNCINFNRGLTMMIWFYQVVYNLLRKGTHLSKLILKTQVSNFLNQLKQKLELIFLYLISLFALDGIVNIFRETVLLTDDRNLRVKALSHNVPVKSLPVFLQFANLQ